MTMITPSYLGETIEYSSLHACRSTLEDPTSSDTMNLLQLLYYLLVEHTEMPEFLLGSAIQGSKASAETQMPPFVRYIEMMQSMADGWLRLVVMLALAYLRASQFGRFEMSEDVQFKWMPLTDEDNRLTLDTLKWAYGVGLVDDKSAISLMPLEIEDADAMLATLRADRDQQVEDNGDAFDVAMQRDAQMYAYPANGNGHHAVELTSKN